MTEPGSSLAEVYTNKDSNLGSGRTGKVTLWGTIEG